MKYSSLIPWNSVKRVLVATLNLDEEVETEYVALLVSRVCVAFKESGFHEDAIDYCYKVCSDSLLIFKDVPVIPIQDFLDPD